MLPAAKLAVAHGFVCFGDKLIALRNVDTLLLHGDQIMKTRIVRIGNSSGVRIPKALLEQSGLEGEVEMTAEDGSLIIRPTRKPRDGWAEAFQEMARRGDDAMLIDSPALSSWDKDEWKWE